VGIARRSSPSRLCGRPAASGDSSALAREITQLGQDGFDVNADRSLAG
jgi:hypothetical protein